MRHVGDTDGGDHHPLVQYLVVLETVQLARGTPCGRPVMKTAVPGTRAVPPRARLLMKGASSIESCPSLSCSNSRPRFQVVSMTKTMKPGVADAAAPLKSCRIGGEEGQVDDNERQDAQNFSHHRISKPTRCAPP